jgi:predicted DNA-binding transcriptional regulator AlpA
VKLLGIAEIAEALDQKAATVAQWYHRGQLPEPVAKLKMGPVWSERSLRSWMACR